MMMLAVALVASYLIGSIPTALIAGKLIGGIDIRKHGSGNAGATNIYRLFGLKAYIATLIIDIFKGFAAVAFIAPLGYGLVSDQRTALLCGIAAIIGHIWTLFAGFRGGKGVATAGGVMFGLAPLVALAAIAVYFIVTFTTKYVSLGSMLAAVSAPVLLLFLYPSATPELMLICIALAILIVYTHRENIKRLMSGEENKTDFLSRGAKQNADDKEQ